MRDEEKSKEQLLSELNELRLRISEYEQLDPQHGADESQLDDLTADNQSADADQYIFKQNQDIIDFITHSRLFSHWPNSLILKLIPLSKFIDFTAGTTILKEGEENDKVYFMVRGEVSISTEGNTILELKRKGDIFGEMSIIRKKVSSATIVAKTFVRVFCIAATHIGDYTGLDGDQLNNTLYRLFAMVMTDKLALTTHKAIAYEVTYQKLIDENTERRKVEEELRKSEENLRSILTSLDDILFTFDKDGRFINHYQPANQPLYSPADAFLGKSYSEVLPLPVVKKIDMAINELVNGGSIQQFDYSIPIEGHIHWYNAKLSPLFSETNEYNGVTLVARDITERKQSEEKMLVFSQAIAQSASMIIITDLEGNIEFANPAFTQITGFSIEDAKGSKPWILKSGQNQAEPFEKAWEKVKNGITWCGEMINMKKNGEVYWEDATISPIKNSAGEIINCMVIKTDITHRKKMEKELIQATMDADAANQAKSLFLANMSHELRTPLNSIIGFSQILERQLTQALTDKHRKYFNTMINSGSHLLEMVDDILDLSKIEAGKENIDLKPFDFGSMLERSCTTVRGIALKKKISIESTIQANLGWLNGDETKLKQVLYNLLSNAVKFTPSGKRVGIEATVARDRFEVTVWDEGVGIPNEYLDLIFDPFEQVKVNDISTEKGTGLGLTISKRLIELHQGTLSVYSEVNKGSRFIISLPGRISVNNETNRSGILGPEDETSRFVNDASLLITEDDAANRELIEAILYDYKLDFAVTGEEAVMMSLEKKYDLVLMDIQLPKMNGIEAMKQIKKNSDEHIPIFALTAFSMKGDKERYLDEGFDDYISKPINIDSFKSKIKKLLE